MSKTRCLSCMTEYDSNQDYCPSCGAPKNFKQKEPHFLSVGTVLENRYLIGKALSSGKFNITYIAFDLNEGQKVVIKEYFPTDLASRMFEQKEICTYDGEKAKRYEAGLIAFIEESNRLKDLSGSIDGVAKILNVFIDNSTAYSVVEYVDGIPLSEVLKNGKLPWNDMVQVMNPLLRSMEVIHAAGIVNYNISPDNIIMTRDKSVKLLSFGGSKLATNLGSIIKKGYSPIELYKEDTAPDPAIDVYSIAAVMYYAVTGVIPTDAVERSNDDKLVSPLAMGIKIPVNINNTIMNALNVNRKYRTPDCTQFLNELNSTGDVKRVVENKKAEETGKIGKKGKALIVVAIIAAILAIVSIFVVAKINDKVNDDSNTIGNTTSFSLQNAVWEDINDEEKFQKNIDSLKKKFGENCEIEYSFQIDAADKDLKENTGKITKQINEPNDAKKTGDFKKVKLVICISPISMPDLEGMTKQEVIQELTRRHISKKHIVFKHKKTNDYKDGHVVSQSVDAGDKIDDLDTDIVIYLANNFTTTTAPAKKSNNNYSGYSGGSNSYSKKSSGSSSKSNSPKSTASATENPNDWDD